MAGLAAQAGLAAGAVLDQAEPTAIHKALAVREAQEVAEQARTRADALEWGLGLITAGIIGWQSGAGNAGKLVFGARTSKEPEQCRMMVAELAGAGAWLVRIARLVRASVDALLWC